MTASHPCSKCRLPQPVSGFQLYKGRPNGQCRACRTEYARQQRAQMGIKPRPQSSVTDDQKQCARCCETKVRSEFSPAIRGRGGLAAYCKACFVARRHENPESRVASALATQQYRVRHRERHLAAHRIYQWERNNRKRTTRDGTVTDAFMRSLYSESICAYCNRVTPYNRRTADHKIPLSRDGIHSASNLTMACRSCNSAKRCLTDTEYRERRARADT